jgi:hypothetical protein
MIAQTQGGKVRLFKPGRLTTERFEEVLRVYWRVKVIQRLVVKGPKKAPRFLSGGLYTG